MQFYHLGCNVIIWSYNDIIWYEMLSSGMKCYQWYHLDLLLSSGTKFYHLGCNVITWDEMLLPGANVIIWDEMLSSGMKCYHLGCNVIIWS
jgi:hypothetical protein